MTTIATNTESISSIKFRTKFEKLVTDENRLALISAFEQFCSYDPSTDLARHILWRLTYNEDIAISTLVENLRLNLNIFSLNNISKLRDELRYQYEMRYGSYLLTEVPNYYASEFEALVKCTDIITADTVTKKCQENCAYNVNPFRAVYLLESNQEKNFFGSIRELGFNIAETQFLKQYHQEIYNLYKAICENFSLESHSSNAFNTSSRFSDKTENSLPFTFGEIADDSTKLNSSYASVTAKNVILNKDVFTEFTHSDDLNILPALSNLGFDLNEVMVKKEMIRNLVDAIEELDAQNNLNS